MANKASRYTWYLVLGDLACFYLGLYLAILLRAFDLPDLEYLLLHFLPFTLIFLVWILVLYIAGLYEFRTIVFRDKLSALLINAQLVNSGLAVLVFYFVPLFLITPKTTLFLDLVITLVFLFGWRMTYVRTTVATEHEPARIMGHSKAAGELADILARVPHYGLRVSESESKPSVIVLDMSDPDMLSSHSQLVPLIFSGVRFFDLQKLYEEITGRVPLDLISDRWVLENISLQPKPVYTILKRAMDIIISLPLFLVSLIFYPIVWVAIKIEDGGPLIFTHYRTGAMGEVVALPKFRSMSSNDPDSPPEFSKDRITKVGRILRNARIDELPQLLAVVRGKLSLIGPRPEFPHIVEKYKSEIPYYDLRHIIKPGLSGWAQVLYNVPAYDAKTNAEKLSYDLYYVKNRSFLLDLKIALKTIKTLLSRAGT